MKKIITALFLVLTLNSYSQVGQQFDYAWINNQLRLVNATSGLPTDSIVVWNSSTKAFNIVNRSSIASSTDSSLFITNTNLSTRLLDYLNATTARAAYTNYGNNTGSSATPTFFTNNYGDSLKRSRDSIFRRVNGVWIFQFKDSVGTGGGGSALYAGVGLKKSSDSTKLYTDSLVVPLVNDNFNMPQIQRYLPAQGLAISGSAVTNYPYASLDSVPYYFSTASAGAGGTGTDYGGVLVNSTSGDSIRVSAPIGVAIGHSIIAGHPHILSPLENNNLQQADVYGTITYRLTQLTNMEWKNMGIGGQTSTTVRNRFMRDAIGLTADAGDGKPTRTLPHKPAVILIDCIINDPFNNLSIETTKDNLTWMAQTCAEYQIPCVMLNSEGDSFSLPSYLNFIAEINRWLASGALNQFGVTVVDNNSFWNSGTYGGYNSRGNDNLSSPVVSDDIHYTQAGYDSLGYIIARVAKLPVLTKMVFVTGVHPVSPITNYNRPTGVTVNGTAYTLPNAALDTVAVTAPTKDSMWIKITSSVNVRGTSTQTGFSSIYYYLDNNPSGNLWYTRKNNTIGSRTSNQNISSLTIKPDRNGTNVPLLVLNNSSFTVPNQNALRLTTTGAGASMVLNGQGNTAQINNAIFTVYGSSSQGISSNGPFYTQATANQLGSLQVGNASTANTTGSGVGLFNNGMQFQYSGGTLNAPSFNFTQWSTATPNITSSNLYQGVISTNVGVGTLSGTSDTSFGYYFNPTFNSTSVTGNQNALGGFFYKPTITAIQNIRLLGIGNTRGDNLFNTQGEKTAIGTMNPAGSAKLDVVGNKQGLLLPRMSTASRDSIGYISSISLTPGSYSVAPTLTITGGTGTGATLGSYVTGALNAYIINPGVGYKTSSTPTVTFTGGTGSGGSATVTVHGADDGLLISNIDSLKLNVAYNETWYTIPKVLINTATLDFSSTAAQTSADLTITVTGATIGDMVSLGVPDASVLSNSCFTARVSATNTVTITYNNYSTGAQDPASGTFKVQVFK